LEEPKQTFWFLKSWAFCAFRKKDILAAVAVGMWATL
jgi:hypothetical protein